MMVKVYFTCMMPARAQLRIIWQMSSMLPERASGVAWMTAFFPVSVMPVSGQSMAPGAMAFTRIFRGASSAASVCASDFSAALLAL